MQLQCYIVYQSWISNQMKNSILIVKSFYCSIIFFIAKHLLALKTACTPVMLQQLRALNK